MFIVQDDQPVAELKPLPSAPAGTALRPFGLCAGEFVVPDDFDAPLPDDSLALVCQALEHNLTLVTIDTAVRADPVRVLAE